MKRHIIEDREKSQSQSQREPERAREPEPESHKNANAKRKNNIQKSSLIFNPSLISHAKMKQDRKKKSINIETLFYGNLQKRKLEEKGKRGKKRIYFYRGQKREDNIYILIMFSSLNISPQARRWNKMETLKGVKIVSIKDTNPATKLNASVEKEVKELLFFKATGVIEKDEVKYKPQSQRLEDLKAFAETISNPQTEILFLKRYRGQANRGLNATLKEQAVNSLKQVSEITQKNK